MEQAPYTPEAGPGGGPEAALPPPRVDLYAAVVPLGTWVLFACLFLVFREVNEDEGWILLAAREVTEGRLPWRDFAFTQGPLLPLLLAGLPGAVPGPLVARVLSATLSAMTLLASMAAARRLAGRQAGWVTGMLLAGNLFAVGFSVVTKTYPLAQALLAAALLARVRGSRRAVLLGAVLLAAATGVRLTTLAALVAYVATVDRRLRGRVLAAATVTVAACWGPFLAMAPEAVAWHTVTCHLVRNAGRTLPEILLLKGRVLADSGLAFAAPLALLAATGAAGLPALVRTRHLLPSGWRLLAQPAARKGPVAFLAIAIVLVTAAHQVAAGPYAEYHLLVHPYLTVLAGVLTGWTLPAVPRLRTALGPVLVGLLVLQAAPGTWRWQVDRTGNLPLAEVDEVAREVARRTHPAEKLFTPHALVAVAADRDVPQGQEMGIFSFQPGLSEPARLHVWGPGDALRALEDPSTGAVLLTASDFHMDERHGPWSGSDREAFDLRLATALETGFDLVGLYPAWGQFREEARLWVRRRPPAGGADAGAGATE